MAKTLTNRLSDQRGETLTETLISMIIAALALVMLSTAVTSVTRIVVRSRQVAQDYCAVSNELATGSAAKKTTTTKGSVTVTETNLLNNNYVISEVTYTQTNNDSPLPGGRAAVTYKAPKSAGGEG